MTDEEIDRMADNFVNAQDFTRVYSVARKAECGVFWKYGFLAGLKAGSPKWHKVADGDLPKTENDVLVYSGEEWRMCIGRYSPKNKAWEAGCDTVAWCEIPEYKGE